MLIGPAGVIIDLGRRSRTFTGSARDAALLQAALDGDGRVCGPAAGSTDVRSTTPTTGATAGPPALRNAGPLCPRHNRWKTRGYRTWRDPTGAWHTYRPDGTEIQAA